MTKSATYVNPYFFPQSGDVFTVEQLRTAHEEWDFVPSKSRKTAILFVGFHAGNGWNVLGCKLKRLRNGNYRVW